MNITDVRVRIVKQHEEGKLKAVASIIIDDCFAVHDIKIISGNDGVFIAMPSRKTSEGDFKDIAHPINTDTREALKEKILKAYEEELKNPRE
ncbi:MAG: septation regulator SpoVG [Clostridia bacterium]|nr:septation regulator SpoVG [Clostridia bacterium]